MRRHCHIQLYKVHDCQTILHCEIFSLYGWIWACVYETSSNVYIAGLRNNVSLMATSIYIYIYLSIFYLYYFSVRYSFVNTVVFC